jgi:hypothetical protein
MLWITGRRVTLLPMCEPCKAFAKLPYVNNCVALREKNMIAIILLAFFDSCCSKLPSAMPVQNFMFENNVFAFCISSELLSMRHN